LEFEYAYRRRTPLNMLPVVMEESMTDTSQWNGSLGIVLGSHLYYKLTSDADAEFDDAPMRCCWHEAVVDVPVWYIE
jgi:hypothetical protein